VTTRQIAAENLGAEPLVAQNRVVSQRLRSRLQVLGIASFGALARQAGVSEWQVRQLRQGNVEHMRLGSLNKLSQALQMQLDELVVMAQPAPDGSASPAAGRAAAPQLSIPAETPSPQRLSPATSAPPSVAALQQEYDRLQQQLAQQRQALLLEFQRTSLYRLEAWMKNWPKVVQVVKTQNPQLPAAKVLALVAPVSQLLASWDVECVGHMGEAIAYDPTYHSLTGNAQPGDAVEVTQPGYRHGEALLHRAEVKPLSSD
jgi:DNA-binding Xre family transcriptional regulator